MVSKIKIFLTANNETKAKRRLKQLKEKGINVSLTQLIDELNERDKRDLNRKASVSYTHLTLPTILLV